MPRCRRLPRNHPVTSAMMMMPPRLKFTPARAGRRESGAGAPDGAERASAASARRRGCVSAMACRIPPRPQPWSAAWRRRSARSDAQVCDGACDVSGAPYCWMSQELTARLQVVRPQRGRAGVRRRFGGHGRRGVRGAAPGTGGSSLSPPRPASASARAAWTPPSPPARRLRESRASTSIVGVDADDGVNALLRLHQPHARLFGRLSLRPRARTTLQVRPGPWRVRCRRQSAQGRRAGPHFTPRVRRAVALCRFLTPSVWSRGSRLCCARSADSRSLSARQSRSGQRRRRGSCPPALARRCAPFICWTPSPSSSASGWRPAAGSGSCCQPARAAMVPRASASVDRGRNAGSPGAARTHRFVCFSTRSISFSADEWFL